MPDSAAPTTPSASKIARSRQNAFCIDVTIIVLGTVFGANNESWLLLIGTVAYFLVRDGFAGGGVGKRVCGIRLIDANTSQLANLWVSVRKNALTVIVFVLAGGVGWLLSMVFSPKIAGSVGGVVILSALGSLYSGWADGRPNIDKLSRTRVDLVR